MPPVNFRERRMLQRNAAPIPLNLAPANLEDVDPTLNNGNNGSQLLDDHNIHSKFPAGMNRPMFAQNFNFGVGAAPSPPPSAGLPHARPRGNRSKSPSSARTSMIQDEDSEWDTSKLLPQFQHTIRRPSLLTPPTTCDSRRQSYDRETHLGYDDGSTELSPPGRRSSVPTHHLRLDQSPDRHANAAFRRSSLATSVTRRDVEDKTDVDVLSEVDSAEEELVEDNADIEGVQEQTAQLKLDDTMPSVSRKRESPEEDASVHSIANTPIPNPFATMHDVPRAYVLKRLLDLGAFFVGHEATAQAFVQAIPLNDKMSLYKVEVVPQNTESEPYRLVKRHRSSESSSEDSDATPPPPTPISISDSDDDEEYTSPRLPVHVEYAVYRLPLLGSMLLSGQVFCGDTLRMPLPYPEVWTAVVGWMYTNKVVRLPGLNVHDQAEMVRDCIEFLGGRV